MHKSARYSSRDKALLLKTRQRGMTLMELMISLTIGLLLVAGLMTLFANSSSSNDELDKSIRQFENGRYAVELLNEDLSHAGFYGEALASAGSPNYVAANACASAIAELGWAPAVDGIAASVPVAIMGLSSAEADALTCLPHHKSGTPAIVVRRLDTVAVAPNDAVAGQVYVQASRCSSSTARFTRATAVTGSPDNFPLQNNDCITPAQVRRYISRVYFIASCSDCGSDTLPTLKRAELGGNQMSVTALVEGIDDIAFEFGFDTAKAGDITQFDGIPDEYRSALSATLGANNNDWKNVVAVRSYLLTRAIETSAGYTSNKTFSMGLAGTRGPFSDGFKRRLYSMTSRLNNVAGLREGS